ncbi:MAG: TonB-dependent receptor [Henriciella sp.]|nr:TonB-dependent receptor [Henriciella sp.]
MSLGRKLIFGASFAAMSAVAGTAAAQVEDSDRTLDKVTVTGSFIPGTPEDAALPVDVLDQGDLIAVGSPSINEILRDLPSTQGLIGETNQFDTRGGQGNEGATTINLRGLGSARTLVLLNGNRHVGSATIGTDVNFIPNISVGRIEVLKDGAAALYGSDAIGGVVNFITRDDFEGFEVSASHKFIDGSDGDTEIAAIGGWASDRANLVVSGEYALRSELDIKEKDWALLDFNSNPQGGWSSIGNPGTLINPNAIPIADSIGQSAVVFGQADPNCEALGGHVTSIASLGSDFCRFQYTYFDNLVEETETIKLLGDFSYDVSDTMTFKAQAAYSDLSMDEWNTSPSYPPQSLVDTRIDADHPGLVDFFDQNPGYAAELAAFGPTDDYAFWGRFAGVAGLDGEPNKGVRETEQSRLVAGLEGTLFNDGLNYDVSVSWSQRERHTETDDMLVENFAFALDGLGGPGCDPATGTPGVGPCEYYNPMSNAIEVSAVNGATNPQYNPDVANSPELLDWLTDTIVTDTTDELLVFDAVFSGMTGVEFSGGTMGWAAGLQTRNEKFEFGISENANLDINPCPFNNPASITNGNTTAVGNDSCSSPTGQFAFLAGSTNTSLERTVYSGFVELALPISDRLDIQLAGRFEDYGGNVGSTLDPKIAAKFQATENLAFRGSASTTFRAPPQPFLDNRSTTLEFIVPTNAFKAVDTLGNPDLEPEKAFATNFGVLFDNANIRASVDYWRFDFTDPLQLESAGQIVAAYQDCVGGATTRSAADCEAIASHIFPVNTSPDSIERVERNWINGGDIVTSGIDFFGEYSFDLGGADASVGIDGTYTIEYESDDFVDINGVVLAEGGDFVGFLNEGTPFQTIVDLRANAFATYNRGPHSLRYTLRYVNDYEDAAPSIPELAEIDSQITHDLTYNLSLFDERTRFSISAINFTDEDPPQASTDLNYDAYTHSPFGRMIKVGVTHTF